jgi:hypothetical protein
MDPLKRLLQPLIDLLPPTVQDYWWLVLLAAVLAVLLVLGVAIRGLARAIAGRRVPRVELDFGPKENLAAYPLPAEPWGRRRLTVEGVPVRLRLVVMASMGIRGTIKEGAVNDVLDQVLWGLGEIARLDQPRVLVWPPQLSIQGFAAAFHRTTPKPEAEGQPSRWILVAGQTPPRPRPVLLGMGLWADQATLIGRLTLEPRQWSEVLRIQTVDV